MNCVHTACCSAFKRQHGAFGVFQQLLGPPLKAKELWLITAACVWADRRSQTQVIIIIIRWQRRTSKASVVGRITPISEHYTTNRSCEEIHLQKEQTERFLTKIFVSIQMWNTTAACPLSGFLQFLFNKHSFWFDICCVVFVAVWRSKEEWPHLTSTPPTRSRRWSARWSFFPPASPIRGYSFVSWGPKREETKPAPSRRED